MYLELILCSLYSVVVLITSKTLPMSFAHLAQGLVIVTMITSVIVFIAGYALFKLETDSAMAWSMFSGFGYNYDVETLKSYTLCNIGRLILILVCLGCIVLVLGHSI